MLEPLESRIALAVTIVNATTATFTDVDGDLVVIKVSKGELEAANFVTSPLGLGEQLNLIDFDEDGEFNGANLAITVKRQGGSGDGLTQIRFIDASETDLGHVSIQGDLSGISCGNDSATVPALKSLTVHSFGRAGFGQAQSQISGGVGPLRIKTDFEGQHLTINGANARLDSLQVGGSIIGGNGPERSGMIQVSGPLGAVKVGGSIVGGNSDFSGSIFALGQTGPVQIGGSVTGGIGEFSGSLLVEEGAASVRVGGNLQGGSGELSGMILIDESSKSVRIGQSIIGGAGVGSGQLRVGDNVQSLVLTGELVGGDVENSGLIAIGENVGNARIGGSIRGGDGEDSGVLSIGKNLGALRLGQSLIGGLGATSGAISVGGSAGSVSIAGMIRAVSAPGPVPGLGDRIAVGGSLGSLTVAHGVFGNALSRVFISVGGDATPAPAFAIGSVKIGGSVEFANIFAGLDGGADTARIGTVRVTGDWIASNLLSGTNAGSDGKPGTADDAFSSPITADLSSIAKLVIKGQVIGTAAKIDDHFGIVAATFGQVSIGGFKLQLSGELDTFELGNSADISLLKID